MNHVCPMFMAKPLDSRLRRWAQNPRKILQPHIREGMHVLDFGCGPGFLTLEAARLVGEAGRVIAADIQGGMLDLVAGKVADTSLASRVVLHRCEADRIGLDARVDFAVAMYVIHEVSNPRGVIRELAELVRPGGHLLLTEPKFFHVSRKAFAATVESAESRGLRLVERPRIIMSWTALLRRVELPAT